MASIKSDNSGSNSIVYLTSATSKDATDLRLGWYEPLNPPSPKPSPRGSAPAKKNTQGIIVYAGVPTQTTYTNSYFRGFLEEETAKAEDIKRHRYVDPYYAMRSIMGLVPNRGLHGSLVVVQKVYSRTNGKYRVGYNTIFPRNREDRGEELGGYEKFLVTNLNMPQSEITSYEQGFGGYWDVHFYGSAPLHIQVSGALLNAYNPVTQKLYAWSEDWFNAYNTELKGSKVAKKKARTFLIVGNYIFSGYLLNTTEAYTVNEGAIAFSFGMIVISVRTLSNQNLLSST